MTDQQKLEAVAAIGELYGYAIESEFAGRIWIETLKAFSLEQVRAALLQLSQQPGRAFMPRPGEVIEAISGPQEALPGPPDKAAAALEVVEQAISRHGIYRSVEFDDPVIHHAIRLMGGWVELCQSKDWRYKRTEFIKCYQTALKVPMRSKCSRLIGLSEMRNGGPRSKLVSKQGQGQEITHQVRIRTGLPWVKEHRAKLTAPVKPVLKSLPSPLPKMKGVDDG